MLRLEHPPQNQVRKLIFFFVLLLSLCDVIQVLTGLGALKYLNIPMFNALRRATTLLTMVGESWLLGARNTRTVQLTVWLMIGGAVLAGFYDFDFNGMGYILVAFNCMATAAYLLYIAQLGKSSGLNTFGLMWYNNAQSIPFVAFLCWYNGDFSEIASYTHLYEWDFLFCFLFQSALAFLLNYSIFLCTQVNSALATSVTGQMKNIITTMVGYFSFGDVTYNAMNVLGLFVGVFASSWYSLLKYYESEASKKTPILPISSSSSSASSSVVDHAQGDSTAEEEESKGLLASSHNGGGGGGGLGGALTGGGSSPVGKRQSIVTPRTPLIGLLTGGPQGMGAQTSSSYPPFAGGSGSNKFNQQ